MVESCGAVDSTAPFFAPPAVHHPGADPARRAAGLACAITHRSGSPRVDRWR